MKSLYYIFSALLFLISQSITSQQNLSNFKDIDRVYVSSYWGNINAYGTSTQTENEFSLDVTHTNSSKKSKKVKEVSKYINIKKKNKTLYIASRKPEGFESIEIDLKIPEDIFLEIKLTKGGEIYLDNFKNGVEVNSLNGSVKLERISDYAFVNAANGEITASFISVDKKKPISLVTLNGGVTAILPKNCKRDLRLISRKNGYVLSDFKIESYESITNLNKKSYAKQPIINTAKINGGGAVLFLSTENGPISIKKSNL